VKKYIVYCKKVYPLLSRDSTSQLRPGILIKGLLFVTSHISYDGPIGMRNALRSIKRPQFIAQKRPPFIAQKSTLALDPAWSELVTKELKGKKADELVWKTAEVMTTMFVN
jgi:hypothetical protein